MKERFSNVLAWFGLLYPAISWFSILSFFMGYSGVGRGIRDIISLDSSVFWNFVVFGLYPCCAIVNYLLVGRFRLLPWLNK